MQQNMPTEEATIFLRSWEICQNLAKSNGETAWKIKTWGVTVWSALAAYSFKENSPEIQYISLVFLFVIMIFELSIRRIQYKFIERSIEIEESINSILTMNQDIQIPERGISTHIDTPSLSDFCDLFKPQRWLLWFPYLVLIGASVIAIKIL